MFVYPRAGAYSNTDILLSLFS